MATDSRHRAGSKVMKVVPAQIKFDYLSGFGNHHESEAEKGALPEGQNSPQKVPFGLYAEQLSGSPFTAPRGEMRRAWTYRLRPTASHRPFARHPDGHLRSGPFTDLETPPNRFRW